MSKSPSGKKSSGEIMGNIARHGVLVKMQPELKHLVFQEANATQPTLSMGEWFVKLAAEHFNRPELSTVPRKSFGRPPKNKQTRNGNGNGNGHGH